MIPLPLSSSPRHDVNEMVPRLHAAMMNNLLNLFMSFLLFIPLYLNIRRSETLRRMSKNFLKNVFLPFRGVKRASRRPAAGS